MIEKKNIDWNTEKTTQIDKEMIDIAQDTCTPACMTLFSLQGNPKKFVCLMNCSQKHSPNSVSSSMAKNYRVKKSAFVIIAQHSHLNVCSFRDCFVSMTKFSFWQPHKLMNPNIVGHVSIGSEMSHKNHIQPNIYSEMCGFYQISFIVQCALRLEFWRKKKLWIMLQPRQNVWTLCNRLPLNDKNMMRQKIESSALRVFRWSSLGSIDNIWC